MKKEHSVFITFTREEVARLLDHEARKQGKLKDVKSTIEYKIDEPEEVTVEYWWEG